MGKNRNKLPDIPTKEKIVRLFESIYLPKLAIACHMGLFCGLRIREACRLETADIDLERRSIKIRDSKNSRRKYQGNYGKDRIVAIPEIAISPIKKWLEIVQGGKWFISSDNNPDNHMKPKTIHQWFAEARERAGLTEVDMVVKRKNQPDRTQYKFNYHSLRHFYAQYVYDKTRDLYAVGSLLGHTRIDTTQVYAKCSEKIKKETIDFAFSTPIKTKIFEENPAQALNYNIPLVAKREKKPIEILEERFAKGEISAVDFQTAIRLLRARKDYLNEHEERNQDHKQVETD